ncbi:SDR family NAD(P)-dependent oxidoreductase [Candidatus Nanohalococcus occultus]|uniref:SDR family NAD(P)-dependent oxidoreductase n=1 Tax=Candidatus Nanohalococcus occultus TaxID=2978047 RepID=UPI0039DFB042
MKKALVTGGAGFIGSNLVEKLVEQDIQVVVLDDLYLGDEKNLEAVKDDIEFINGSVLDEKKVEKAVADVDTVFHLAARSSSPMHKEDAAEGANVNVTGFVNTVEAAKQAGVEKVVYASTSSMYGSVKPPHTEEDDVRPPNLYTASKLAREVYADCYSYREEIQTTGLRFFSVYGPHEKSKGKFANIVTQFLWKIQNGESPVIWGDGKQQRDLVYVEDVANALIKAAETRKELDGEVFNVGTGRPQSFNTVVKELNNVLGTDIEAEHVENPRDNYVEQHCADLEKTEQVLGWEPEYSFEQGLEKIADYYS